MKFIEKEKEEISNTTTLIGYLNGQMDILKKLINETIE